MGRITSAARVGACAVVFISLATLPSCGLMTTHCASFLEATPESNLAYPGARLVHHDAFEGHDGVDDSYPPRSFSIWIVDATAADVLAWYQERLQPRGWHSTGVSLSTANLAPSDAHGVSFSRGCSVLGCKSTAGEEDYRGVEEFTVGTGHTAPLWGIQPNDLPPQSLFVETSFTIHNPTLVPGCQ